MLKGSYPLERFAQLPTPFYYYDTALLQQTLDTVCAQVADRPTWQVHYAIKANHNPQILRQIAAAGLGADCVSGGEVQAALDAGFAPEGIVFAGVWKADWEMRLGLEAGIGRFNVESTAELQVLSELATSMGKTALVSIRVNPDIGAHTLAGITTGLAENKFGIAMQDMEHVIALARSMSHVPFSGLHFHIGSQILQMDDFAALCLRINELQDRLEQQGFSPVEHINVGGGLGIDYADPDAHPIPEFQSYFQTYANQLKLRPGQQLHFELGRAIVGQCGSLITRCLYVKEGSEKSFAIVDAGMTELIRPALYGALHQIENLSNQKGEETYDVVGPICESSDVFAKAYKMPTTQRGNLMAIRSAGAYGEVMASQYNCRRLPMSYTDEELNK